MIDLNKEPNYITDGPNGKIQWFYDSETTNYANEKSLDYKCFVVIHSDKSKERVIIENNKIIYAKAASLEEIACFIDIMNFTKNN